MSSDAPESVWNDSIAQHVEADFTPVRIKTGARTRVTLPAGTFDAYRVEVTAEEHRMVCPDPSFFPTIVYVAADSLRLVLRVERPQQHVTLDLRGWGPL